MNTTNKLLISLGAACFFSVCCASALLAQESESSKPSVADSSFVITDEMIMQIVEDPKAISRFISTATEGQVAEIIIRVIIDLQEAGSSDSTIQSSVGTMVSETTKARGANFGTAVMNRIRKRVHPRLLPTISVGGGGGVPPPPPAPAPKYDRQ